jgi:ATP/ADP translocase
MKLLDRYRKFKGMVLMAAIGSVVAYFIKADKVMPVTLMITGLYASFCGAHAYTDAKAKKDDA